MDKYSVGDYKIEISKLPEDEGGGYLAVIPALGCIGDGETQEEAISDVLDVAETFIALADEQGIHIPDPQYYNDEKDKFSGKLSLRIPKFLHQKINQLAKEEGCSINQLLTTFISIGVGREYEKHININIKYHKHNTQEGISTMNAKMWGPNEYSNKIINLYN